MKRLKIFGLLAVIALLAFGLALSCDSSTPAAEEPGSPAPVAHYSLDGGRLGLYFSQDPSRLPRATGTSAEDGDYYVLIEELSRRVLSAGLATVGVNGSAITLNPNQTDFPDQEPFDAEISSDGGISVVGAPDGSGGTIGTITGEREGSGAYQPGQGGQGGQGGSGGNGGQTAAKYTVTFNTDGGSTAPAPVTNITSGSTITLPTPPTKADFDFAGWFLPDGTTEFTASTPVTATITVKAKWVAVVDPSLEMWEEIRVKNAELIALQVLEDEGADAALAALSLLVDDAFRNSDVTKWISDAGDGIHSQVKGSGQTTLYYINSELDASNTITFDNNLPSKVTPVIDSALNGLNTRTVTLTYAIGDPGSSNTNPTYKVVLQPISLYKVVFEPGATGKVVVLEADTDKGGTLTESGEVVLLPVSNTFKTTTVTVKIPDNMMSRSAAFSGSFSFNGDDDDEVVVSTFAQTSSLYKITISPLGYTVTFHVNTITDNDVHIPLANTFTRNVTPGEAIGAANWPTDPKMGGYTFVNWNRASNGTGPSFTVSTKVTDDGIDVYAKWSPVADTNAPWGKIAHMNAVIKDMPAGANNTEKQTRLDAIADVATEVRTELRRMAATGGASAGALTGTNEIYSLFNLPNAKVFSTKSVKWNANAGTAVDPGQLDFGYVNSLLTTTTIPTKTLPAGLEIEGYSLSSNLTSSYDAEAYTRILYPIGNDDGEGYIGLRFYPMARFEWTWAATLTGKNVKITDETHPDGTSNDFNTDATGSRFSVFDIGDATTIIMDGTKDSGIKIGSISLDGKALVFGTDYDITDNVGDSGMVYEFTGGVKSGVYAVTIVVSDLNQ